ncbi:hypothetical protein Tco_1388861, partial [Tanacetum coccineum]
VDEKVFPTVVAWRTGAPKDGMPPAGSCSALDVTTLNTRRTHIQKQPELMLCLVGQSRRYFLGDDVYPTFLYDDDRGRNGFVQFDQYPKSCKDMDTTRASRSFGTPSTMEKSSLDFADEDLPPPNTEGVRTEEGGHHGAPVNKRRKQIRRKRANDEAEANAPPKVLRKDHGASTATKSVSNPDPLSYAKPQPYPEQDIAQCRSSSGTATEIPTEHVATTEVNVQLSVGSPESGRSTSVPFVVGSPGDFLSQYNMNLTRQVAMGSQLRLRFEQEVRLLKKARAKIARRDQRIQVREEEIKKLDQEVKSLRATETEVHDLCNQTKNLETLLEAEADMKKAAEAKNAELTKELESLRVWFSDLQVNNNQLSQQVSNFQAQITSEEEIKGAFEQFKKYEDDRVEQRCTEMDACLDKLSVDFDEVLYPHTLTVIAGRRWVTRHDLRLVLMKCAESTELSQVFANVANDNLVKALQDLKDLEYPMVDQLERLNDARIELIMASLHLEDPWAVKEQMLLEDAIAANISRAEKKKKCRVVRRTYGIGFAYHARSNGIPVSAPTVVPQGLAILLADATTQTEAADKEEAPHPRLQRSISLPHVYNL